MARAVRFSNPPGWGFWHLACRRRFSSAPRAPNRRARQSLGRGVSTRRHGRTERRNPVQRPRLLCAQAEHRRRRAGVGRTACHRPRWILRVSSCAHGAKKHLRQETIGIHSRRRLAGQQPLAFRFAGLHGARHAGHQKHAGWLAKSMSR